MQNLILSFKKELGVQNEKLVIHIYVVFIVLFLQNNFTDDRIVVCLSLTLHQAKRPTSHETDF